MKVFITKEISCDMSEKLDITNTIETEFEKLNHINYGSDLLELGIGVICVEKKFDFLFQPRKPKYRKEAKEYMHKGVQVSSEPRYFSYDLKLCHTVYSQNWDIEKQLATDILQSLDTIKNFKKIKDFNFQHFEKDVANMFINLGWL